MDGPVNKVNMEDSISERQVSPIINQLDITAVAEEIVITEERGGDRDNRGERGRS